MPRLLIEKGPDRGKSITVSAGQQIVAGRDKSADLQLSDNMASRRHFMIASKGNIFGVKDLNSANGTLVNGRRCDGAAKLQFGDSIQVGETLLSWLSDEQAGTRGGLVGQAIGGYRIEERLGRGAMGTVYRATQLSLGRTVALKVLAPDLTKDAKFCEMFLKEARAAGSLNHPNIIQVYDVGDEKGSYYFSMEFAAKGSVLDELQVQKTIPLPRSVRIIRDACAALDYAERKGLVHRDIKPDNLMVMEDDTVKLGDLGLAMSTVELQAEQDGVFGTPHYIAPEQAMGKPIDHRADIYALGATFYRMLSGKTMFGGATVKEILRKQVREAHPPITDYVPDCPEGIRRILDRMLAKNPAERYQHAGDVASDLADYENLAARKGGGQPSAFAVRPTGLGPDQSQRIAASKSRRNLVLAAVSALLAVAAAVTVVWFFLFGGAETMNGNNAERVGEENIEPPADNTPRNGNPQSEADNRGVDERIGVAKDVLRRATTKEELDEEIEQIDRASQIYPRASADRLKELDELRDALKKKREALTQGEQEAAAELEEAGREANGRIQEFRFEAAKQPLADFIAKWKESKNEKVQSLVGIAQTQLNNQPVRFQTHLNEYEQRIRREADEAMKQPVDQRQAAVAALAQQVRDAETVCDEAVAKGRLGRLAGDLEGKAKIAGEEADRAAKQALEQAFTRASTSLAGAMEQARQHIARGDFKSAAQPLEDWVLKDADYLAYGNHARFAELRGELKMRREQTQLEYESLRILSASMPKPIDQVTLLRVKPWPEHAAGLFNDPRASIAMIVNRELSDSAWQLQVVVGTNPARNMTSAEFSTPEKARGLAAAIAHLFAQDPEMRDGLMRNTQSGPQAILGVIAWLCELEAYTSAAVLAEHAWEKIPSGKSHHALVREYYAWCLLGRAKEANLAGKTDDANKLIDRLKKEFANTQAAKRRR